MKDTINALAALAHASRLGAFRLLVEAGSRGLPAGDIAETLDIPNNTLSTHLSTLTRSGLATAERDGRRIVYRANFDGMRALLGFLMKDCCKADRTVTASALATLGNQCCAITNKEQSA